MRQAGICSYGANAEPLAAEMLTGSIFAQILWLAASHGSKCHNEEPLS